MFSASDTVLVASDGLWDNLFFAEVVECVRKDQREPAAGQRVELARQRMATPATQNPAKPDDLSFILYRTDSRGLYRSIDFSSSRVMKSFQHRTKHLLIRLASVL